MHGVIRHDTDAIVEPTGQLVAPYEILRLAPSTGREDLTVADDGRFPYRAATHLSGVVA
jgi:hypothetical protein